MSKQQFPFVCQIKGTKEKFVPELVDYKLEKVLSIKFEWTEFKDLDFFPNHDFALPGHTSLRDFILDSEIEFSENKALLESQNETCSANHWAGAMRAITMLKEKIFYNQ